MSPLRLFLPTLLPHLSAKRHHPNTCIARSLPYMTTFEAQIAWYLNHISHYCPQTALSLPSYPFQHWTLQSELCAASSYFHHPSPECKAYKPCWQTRTSLYWAEQTPNGASRKRWPLSCCTKNSKPKSQFWSRLIQLCLKGMCTTVRHSAAVLQGSSQRPLCRLVAGRCNK